VETGFEDRSVGMEISDHVREAELFYNLPDGDLYHLSRICKLRTHPAGTVLIREGDAADRLFQLVDGRAEARSGDRVLGMLGADAVFGEMGLVESAPRSADVVITEESRVIQIEIDQLERLMDRQPRLGHLVMRNLARGLSEKLRAQR
jgi:CRP-like cAMP-binding protein